MIPKSEWYTRDKVISEPYEAVSGRHMPFPYYLEGQAVTSLT